MICPLCNAPIKWIHLWDDTWSPCDELPVIFTPDPESKTQIIRRHELVHGVIYSPKQGTESTTMGRLPHYYSCPVLRKERKEWARKNYRKEREHGKAAPHQNRGCKSPQHQC